jgi:heptosyltransferase-2
LPKQLKIIIVQTAFIGDVVLALPLAQVLRKKLSDVQIDFVVIPRTAGLLVNHPAINNVIIFDKRGVDKGVFGLINLSRKLKSENYDVAIVPHRSIRSALLVRMAGCIKRIGFSKSAGKKLFTDIVPYPPSMHEVERNLTLLRKMAIIHNEKEPPQVYPTDNDKEVVDKLLFDEEILDTSQLIGVAPGSVWKTKRWMMESYVELVKKLVGTGYTVGLIGGEDDVHLCNMILKSVNMGRVFNTAGKLTLLQSAEMIKRCNVVVSNDSAPIHLAAAVNTPVVAIFGATVPAFGFAPYSDRSVVVETDGLRCRPCSIHGGDECPIKTFDCMKRITADMVFEKVVEAYYKK